MHSTCGVKEKKKSAVACRTVKAHKTTIEGASECVANVALRCPIPEQLAILPAAEHWPTSKGKTNFFCETRGAKSRSFRSVVVPIQKEDERFLASPG